MRKSRWFVFMLIFFLGFGALSFAQTPASGGDFTHLTLAIATTKQKFIELEPIPITLTLHNPTAKPILGHTFFDFHSHLFELFVTRPNGVIQKVEPLSAMSPFTIVKSRPIAPGERYTIKHLWMFRLDEIFPKPGRKYSVNPCPYL